MDYIPPIYDVNYYFNIYFYLSAFLIFANSFFFLQKQQDIIAYIVNSFFCIAFTVATTYKSAVFVDEYSGHGNPTWLYFLIGQVVVTIVVIYIYSRKNRKKEYMK
ncbi:hypothetical protein [Metaclostridioides mangenotii]|uniref:hypothetical protein n=1 Tax=Metaclostridioides mangenotii TaxID=1540 RepID=UPI000466F840|nr:hypothetical protein [Clostridioides mangenotii]